MRDDNGQSTPGRGHWKQGEHILLAAPTSAGKSTLMKELVRIRGHVVVFVSKTKDDTFADTRGWDVIQDWKQYRSRMHHILLWPGGADTLRGTVEKQRPVFRDALDKIGSEQGWTPVIDELAYMTDRQFCGLDSEVKILHHQGRSQGISMVTLTQRPAWVPKIIYSSVTHAYVARTRDQNDLKRLADLGGIDAREMGRHISALPDRHDYVYLNPQGDYPPVIVNTRQ